MPPSSSSLSEILNNPVYYLFRLKKKPHPGELQYCGPHFLAVISYADKLAFENTFRDGFSRLHAAAYGCWYIRSTAEGMKFLRLLASSLTEIREFFIIPDMMQYPSDIFFKKVVIIESFIDFLVNAFEILSGPTHSWIVIPGQINILCERLKLLLAVLWDMPFQCTELEERANILAKIEHVANDAGIFLYSFFFTTDHVTMATMDLELSLLLSKLDVVEEMIKHYVTDFEQQKSTTPKFTSASIFIVDSLLDDLNHLLNHKANLFDEVKDQITTFHKELNSSRSMLRDIQLQHNEELIECEISQLINLANQAEPIIGRLVAGEVPVCYLALRLSSFIQRNKPIEAKLANIKLNLGISGIQIAESSGEVSSSRVVTKSIPLVGFKEITEQITGQLIGKPNPLLIISIVGMGGLGKTILARKLFDDSNVLLRFDRRAWCVVSQTYHRRKLLIDILSYVSAHDKDQILDMEDHQLVERLYKSLKGTRYLIVMDDIWKIEVWEDLKRYFPNDRNGSRILFTTRNKDVALHASSEELDFIHDLPSLTDGQCWDLLQTKVFPNSLCPLELQDVGKKITKNCKGLPLAVVGIAAVLANIEEKEGLWQEVAAHLSSYVSKDQDILELSYKHLPAHLKPCFLYLSTFDEDKEIPVKELFSLWISQGFIPTIKGKSPEDVAEDYLLELINRSMVQPAKKRLDKRVKTCTIHDLMRDMSLRLADKEIFFKVINKEYSIDEQHHHIRVHSCSSHFKSFGPHILSLLGNFSDISSITSIMIRLKVLKLLRPKLFKANINYDGTVLKLLVQLRHLERDERLRNFDSHMKLEFLRLEMPLVMDTQLNMPKLKHLEFSSYRKIPESWDNSLLNSLQTLSRIVIEDSNGETRLRRFSDLRRLRCRYDRNSHRCPDSPDLRSLSQLVSLNVESSFGHEFKLFNFPINIKELSISYMPITPGVLLSIGSLPKLEILNMKRVAFRETRWDMSEDQFMKVKFLKLFGVLLGEWNISEDHLPNLEQLIWDHQMCPLPSELGYIPTLQRIEVYNCDESVKSSARKIMEEQEEEGNEQLKVIISGALN